ncbi:DNA helicase MCM8-like [Watersipora subatra]|uniref:DNA helicase MCM8-like n=1 Tax=Watersipora subatra TaxID=2589382 RepID=UPI00355B514E
MSGRGRQWRPWRGRAGRWQSSGRRNLTTQSQPSQGVDRQQAASCPYDLWCEYFPSEGFNPVSESARLVQLLETFFESTLGYIDVEALEQAGHHDLDYQQIVHNKHLMEAVEDLPSLIRDRSELFLSAAGVAFTKVVDQQQRTSAANVDGLILPLPYIVIRLRDIGPPVPFHSLKASYYGKFITLKGTVARLGSVKPFCTRMAFQCSSCDHIFSIRLTDGQYRTPTVCTLPGCTGHMFTPLRGHSLTKTIDWQQIRLQETMMIGDGDSGRVPRTVDCELTADLTGSCVPGDSVTVCGLVQVATQDQGKGKNKDKCTFTLNMRANSLSRTSRKTLSERGDGERESQEGSTVKDRGALELSTRDLYCIQTIHEQEDIFKLLVHSLCPSIYGHELVKASLLLGLFGGCQKHLDSGTHVPVRGDPHILVVGDPGLGKSQMLQAAAAVAPRGVYVCGNTTTSSGLTVTLTKEAGSGDYSIEAGALVLSDQGTCCIDEFDKMGQQHQALLEAMEQQSISIAKAGIVCSLPARTSILAAANPIGGHYNKAKTVSENLKLSGPLLSRFDLVFILLDKPNEEMDALLSMHVMALHGTKQSKQNLTSLSQTSSVRPSQIDLDSSESRSLSSRLKLGAGEKLDLLPPPLLRKYISYARDYVYPKISEEAAKVIQEFYIELRRRHHSSDSTPITTRQLESLVRLTEAKAKIELREEATRQDAQDIIEIMKYSMVDTYSDETGVLDFTRTQHGSGMSNRAAGKALLSAMQRQFKATMNNIFNVADIKALIQRYSIGVKDFDTLLESLNQQGFLLMKGRSTYQLQAV